MCPKVLIVDDEVAIRDALGRKLKREGFAVTLAGNGLEGLRAFHSERPDTGGPRLSLSVSWGGDVN